MASTDGDDTGPTVGLDEKEFDEAFRVFSSGSRDSRSIAKTNSALVPFLKSLGLKDDAEVFVQRIKDKYTTGHSVSKEQLREVLEPVLTNSAWPADDDVKRAFRVFDSEALGFIKVTLLKRFLVQSQLGVDDSVLEQLIREHCHIDGDDLINYEEFIDSIRRLTRPDSPSPY